LLDSDEEQTGQNRKESQRNKKLSKKESDQEPRTHCSPNQLGKRQSQARAEGFTHHNMTGLQYQTEANERRASVCWSKCVDRYTRSGRARFAAISTCSMFNYLEQNSNNCG